MSNLDLDSLLADAMAGAKAKQDIATARKKAVTARPGSDEFKEANEYVKQWEKEHHWKSVAIEAMFVRDVCSNCNSITTSFQGLFEVRQHVHHADRLDKQSLGVQAIPVQLPKRSFVHESSVRFCANCAEIEGFPSIGD